MLIKNKEQFCGKTIGIQLRMGDTYLNIGRYKNLEINNLHTILDSIRSLQSFDSVFLTSDNQEAINIALEYFSQENTIYDNSRISHTDRMEADDLDTLKVFSDILTLSKTDFRYVSLGSNFGRVANLLSKSPLDFKLITNSTLTDISLEGFILLDKQWLKN